MKDLQKPARYQSSNHYLRLFYLLSKTLPNLKQLPRRSPVPTVATSIWPMPTTAASVDTNGEIRCRHRTLVKWWAGRMSICFGACWYWFMLLTKTNSWWGVKRLETIYHLESSCLIQSWVVLGISLEPGSCGCQKIRGVLFDVLRHCGISKSFVEGDHQR